MISDAEVYELGDRMLLDLPVEVKDGVLARFDDLIFTEDVQLDDLTTSWATVALHGPAAFDLAARGVADRTSEALRLLDQYEHRAYPLEHGLVHVARVDGLGLPGLQFYGPSASMTALVERLRAVGVVTLDEAAREALRIAAGRPEFGVDMDEETIPLEANLEDRAISFTKGCYVGQEVIVRIVHRGHGRVARRLVGIVAETSDAPVPSAGDRIYVADQEVGRITSAARSPALERPIALGYVHRDHVAPGTAVTIADMRTPARVAALPIEEN